MFLLNSLRESPFDVTLFTAKVLEVAHGLSEIALQNSDPLLNGGVRPGAGGYTCRYRSNTRRCTYSRQTDYDGFWFPFWHLSKRVSPTNTAALQPYVDDKATKIARYRLVVPEVWLLLVIDGHAPSQFLEPSQQPPAVASPFDRTYLYYGFSGEVQPLPSAPDPPEEVECLEHKGMDSGDRAQHA